MAIAINSICELLAEVEGKRVTVGYVPSRRKADGKGKNYVGRSLPCSEVMPDFPATGESNEYAAMGSSGVTICKGVDLGAYDVATLSRYGVPAEIVNKLLPYLGLKKDSALSALYRDPLIISPEAATLLDESVLCGDYKTRIAPAYLRASGVSLESLPPQAQAVIFSVLYQYGPTGWRNAAPKTWEYLCAQNWCAAANELCTGFDNSQYKDRRKTEGELLKELC